MPNRETAIKHATILAAYLLIVWGFYRLIIKLPDTEEELIVKPLLWLVPVVYLLAKEKKGLATIGVTGKNLFPAIYLSLGLGAIFAVEGFVINYLKHGQWDFSANLGEHVFWLALTLSLVTAISEELTFRGYLFTRVRHALKSEWAANLSTSFVWALIHVPIALFWWRLDAGASFLFLILAFIFGIGSAFIFARTGNIISSILLHVMWAWPIVLFR
jgi:membrane protease YdiL (CAAX protease family)